MAKSLTELYHSCAIRLFGMRAALPLEGLLAFADFLFLPLLTREVSASAFTASSSFAHHG